MAYDEGSYDVVCANCGNRRGEHCSEEWRSVEATWCTTQRKLRDSNPGVFVPSDYIQLLGETEKRHRNTHLVKNKTNKKLLLTGVNNA